MSWGEMQKKEIETIKEDSEETLLGYLINRGYEPEDYLDTLDNIETAQEEKKYLEEHPEEANEEAQYIDDDIAVWEEELKDMREDWKPEKEPNMDEEIKCIRKWIREKEYVSNQLAYQQELAEGMLADAQMTQVSKLSR